MLGYDKPPYLMAFDHRGSFEHDLFGATEPVSDEVRDGIISVKEIIFDAHVHALTAGAPPSACGVLVDEEFGAGVARRAKSEGVPRAMPVERSGQEEFEFQYGEDFGAHIESFDPTFAKVLVRYNPEGDAGLNQRQTGRLARLSQWLGERNRKFLFELLVPATAAQLDKFADCEAVVAQARTDGRGGVKCIVLGRGADEPQVLEWVRIGASVDGFDAYRGAESPAAASSLGASASAASDGNSR